MNENKISNKLILFKMAIIEQIIHCIPGNAKILVSYQRDGFYLDTGATGETGIKFYREEGSTIDLKFTCDGYVNGEMTLRFGSTESPFTYEIFPNTKTAIIEVRETGSEKLIQGASVTLGTSNRITGLDGRAVFVVMPDIYSISVSKLGYIYNGPVTADFRYVPDNTPVYYYLSPQGIETAVLNVESTLDGIPFFTATVWINGMIQGYTPFTSSDKPAGTYQVYVEHGDYGKSKTQTVTTNTSTPTTVTCELTTTGGNDEDYGRLVIAALIAGSVYAAINRKKR